MGRSVVLGNGHILVGLDDFATVHDFYYPYVGLENLTTARFPNHKVGVWLNNEFSWLDDGSWQIDIDFEEDALISEITATNEKLKIKLHFNDFVDSHYPAFCRMIDITYLGTGSAEVRLFLHQAFAVSRSGRSDTALFIPKENYILDYKGWSSLLIYCQKDSGQAFDQWAVGNHGIEGKEGTFRDAEDGELSNSLVEHGSVDSTMRLCFKLENNQSVRAEYWVVASESQFDAEAVHHVFQQKGAKSRLEATRQSWHEWIALSKDKLDKIDSKHRKLAKKSLLLIKAHADRHGGIIASSDSSIYNYGRDYYCYVWPRDAAYTVLPLISIGYRGEPKKFFDFCADTLHPGGYMMHKYQPDRAVGSTWHPQLHLNHPELPIQEDETAIVIYCLYKYLEKSGDDDFVRSLYKDLIKECADFMATFIDDATNLPHPSYDLWEQRFATFTYSTYITALALESAAAMAEKFDEHDDKQRWLAAARKIAEGQKLLINPASGAFRKSVLLKPNGDLEFDDNIDASSFYGAFLYGKTDEETLRRSVKKVEEVLLSNPPIGGVPRYEHDDYFLSDRGKLGNPWMITTLWLAQYYIANNQREDAKKLIDWVAARASNSGMLSEQADPNTGIGVGVTPLVWSHSTFLETVLMLAGEL